MFSFSNSAGAPLVAAILVAAAIILHFGIAAAFSGSVQF